MTTPANPARRLRWLSPFRLLWLAINWVTVSIATAWAFGALWYDAANPTLRHVVALIYGVVLGFSLKYARGSWRKIAVLSAGFFVVLVWWLTLQPSSDRAWQPDVAQTPWAEIDGDRVTLHNVRRCEYRTETDYTPIWETRTVDLSKLQGIDLALNYWGSAWMAHPIISFQFADAPPVCFSIETRKEVGESYSAIGGLYRQYELVYVCADERDVIRVRTNFRKGEDVYLYRSQVPVPQARQRFLEYIGAMNALRDRPRWYNAATTNCTTSIRAQRAAESRAPWDWRILFNGYGDEMLYEHGALASDGRPFAELKAQARINDAARAADTAPDFSARIRQGRLGFSQAVPTP